MIPSQTSAAAGSDAAAAPDPRRWSRAGVLAVTICAIAGGIDSFDTQMIGFTGRLIALDLHFPMARLGWLFGAGQLGGVVGALVFGSLADRLGRGRVLIVTCLIAAAFTFAALNAHDYPSLLAFRVLTGVGLGGMLPCFLGLGVDAMPARVRVAMTPVLYASFPVGGVVGAWVSAPLIVAYGWRGVFAAGAAALVAVAIVLVVTPVTRARGVTVKPDSGRVSALLSNGRAPVTLTLWTLFLLAPAGVYLLVLWMPPLLQSLGVPAARTSVLVGVANLGALFVSIGGGWMIARFGNLRVIAPTLFVGACGFAMIVAVHRDFGPLAGVTFITGAALGGSMALLVSMAATSYPSELRATGIGWVLGIARIGQMTAPLPVGLLLEAKVPPGIALSACGLPTLLSLIPLLLLDRARRRMADGTPF